MRTGLLLAALLVTRWCAGTAEPTLVALIGSGTLLLFTVDRPEAAREVEPSGVSGHLVGVDVRPADRRLHGVTATSEIYRGSSS